MGQRKNEGREPTEGAGARQKGGIQGPFTKRATARAIQDEGKKSATAIRQEGEAESWESNPVLLVQLGGV